MMLTTLHLGSRQKATADCLIARSGRSIEVDFTSGCANHIGSDSEPRAWIASLSEYLKLEASPFTWRGSYSMLWARGVRFKGTQFVDCFGKGF